MMRMISVFGFDELVSCFPLRPTFLAALPRRRGCGRHGRLGFGDFSSFLHQRLSLI